MQRPQPTASVAQPFPVGLLYALYALSGFIALAYQVIWFRAMVDRFGSTNLTFVLVLVNFIGGLGAGALASRRVQALIAWRLRITDALRAYGLIELLIGAAVLLTVLSRQFPADLFGHFPYARDAQGIDEPILGLQLWRVLVAAACVFVPCFFMGVTFPLLCAAYPGVPGVPSSLYAWNTLGACAALLAGEFVLLPALGHDRMLWLILGLNAALGLLFLIRGGAPTSPNQPSLQPASARTESATAPDPRADHPSFWLTCAVLSGLLCGALEGDMFKRLWFLSCDSTAAMSFISMWAILGIFLASWTVRAASWLRFRHIQIAMVVAVVVYAILWHFAQDLRHAIGMRVIRSVLGSLDQDQSAAATRASFAVFQNHPGEVLLFVGLFVFPAYFLASLLLPYACNRIHGSGRHVGLAYGLNTAAFCAGVLALGWAAPRVSVFYSLKLALLFIAVLAIVVLVLREGRRVRAWTPVVAAAALAIACAIIPRGFEKSFFTPDSLPAIHPVHSLKSNGAHTIFVVDDPAGRRLFFDSYSMSGTGADIQRYMRLMAHVPLLAQDNPQAALLICFGVGNTASAIAKHQTIQRIDVVDLNDKVFLTAPEFAATNDRVDQDPRVRLIHDDGRNFLNLTDQRYDLVTSEPPPPLEDGVARLYSVEYYRSVLAHLTPNGMMTQWLPVWQMPREAVNRAVATFLSVFPNALLFIGNADELILLGGRVPIDLATVERRFYQAPAVVRDLQQLQIDGPVNLLARVIQSDRMLRQAFGDGRIISDQRNDLAYLFRDPTSTVVIGGDVEALLADLGLDRLRNGAALRQIMTRPQLLIGAVPDVTIATLKIMQPTGGGAPAAGQVDCETLAGLLAAIDRALAARRTDDAMTLMRHSLDIAPDQPAVLLRMGKLQAEQGLWEDSLAACRRYAELGMADGRGEFGMGYCLLQLHRPAEAIAALRSAVQSNPGLAAAHGMLGDALANAGNLAEAVACYDRALLYQPDDASAQANRRKALSLIQSPAAR